MRGHITLKVALHFGKYGTLQKNLLKLIKAADNFLLKSIFSVWLACCPPKTDNIYYIVFTLGYSLSPSEITENLTCSQHSLCLWKLITRRGLAASRICLEPFPIKKFRQHENFIYLLSQKKPMTKSCSAIKHKKQWGNGAMENHQRTTSRKHNSVNTKKNLITLWCLVSFPARQVVVFKWLLAFLKYSWFCNSFLPSQEWKRLKKWNTHISVFSMKLISIINMKHLAAYLIYVVLAEVSSSWKNE